MDFWSHEGISYSNSDINHSGYRITFLKVTSIHGNLGKNLIWKQRSFHLLRLHFFCMKRAWKYHENFHERFHKILLFERVLLYSQLLQNQFASRWYKSLRQLLKIKRQDKESICESSTLPSSYLASILIVKCFANNCIHSAQW